MLTTRHALKRAGGVHEGHRRGCKYLKGETLDFNGFLSYTTTTFPHIELNCDTAVTFGVMSTTSANTPGYSTSTRQRVPHLMSPATELRSDVRPTYGPTPYRATAQRTADVRRTAGNRYRDRAWPRRRLVHCDAYRCSELRLE